MRTKVTLLAVLAVTVGCGSEPGPAHPSEDVRITESADGKADHFETHGGDVAITYDEFKDSLYCEPDGGPCIVQGDIPIWGEEALREYYDSRMTLTNALTVMQDDAVDAVWDRTQRFDLSFCISDRFGERKGEVVEAFISAATEWEDIAHVDFRYKPEEDDRCHRRNAQVLFNVRPTDDEWAWYIARAFFPHQPRAEREVLVNFPSHDDMLEDEDREGDYTLRGVMRHELGHVLGFRHEHIRDEADAFFCREDDDYRVITEYDSRSVMHYPQCNGEGDWGLALTDVDARGAAFFYPDFDDYEAARCDTELDEEGRVVETCEPVAHELLELANNASREVLDDWVRLDVRAVDEMVDQRETEPFNTLAELRDIRYFEDVGIRKMYDYLYVNGRCPVEMDDNGLVNAQCKPVVHRILELANHAPLDELDHDVRLDSRAAANIAVIRKDRPFASFAELWDVDYVKTRAFGKMYDYLYPE